MKKLILSAFVAFLSTSAWAETYAAVPTDEISNIQSAVTSSIRRLSCHTGSRAGTARGSALTLSTNYAWVERSITVERSSEQPVLMITQALGDNEYDRLIITTDASDQNIVSYQYISARNQLVGISNPVVTLTPSVSSCNQ